MPPYPYYDASPGSGSDLEVFSFFLPQIHYDTRNKCFDQTVDLAIATAVMPSVRRQGDPQVQNQNFIVVTSGYKKN